MKTIQIAIDGPASSGKSTVAKIIAKDFGYTYLDTGAMYRAATYMALKHQLRVEEIEELLALLDQHPISFGRSETGEQLVFVGDGPYRETLEMKAKEYGVEQSVIFTGMVSPK